jgi:hypothetical protein
MTPGILLMFVLALSGIGFAVGRQRALSVAGGDAPAPPAFAPGPTTAPRWL